MKTITYTRRSLACQYFPDAEPEQAVRRLTSWIRRCRPLYAELTRGGTPFDKRRYLTVRLLDFKTSSMSTSPSQSLSSPSSSIENELYLAFPQRDSMPNEMTL